jgi:hypothetical protein
LSQQRVSSGRKIAPWRLYAVLMLAPARHLYCNLPSRFPSQSALVSCAKAEPEAKLKATVLATVSMVKRLKAFIDGSSICYQ